MSAKKAILCILALVMILGLGSAGCGSKEVPVDNGKQGSPADSNTQKYHVDYRGQKSMFKGAQDEYAPGETVRLVFYLWATDTDYSFYLDGEYLRGRWDEDLGFVLEFTMPDHDVTVSYEMRNSMEMEAE